MIPAEFKPYTVIIILMIAMVFFIWRKLRYDVVALVALAISVIVGVVPFKEVFSGVDNPAVITVLCMMIITATITKSNILNLLVKKCDKLTRKKTLHIFSFSFFIAVISAFMNNVGALGLMLPVSVYTALKNKRSPSSILMPLAMASALGGMVTLIGTPPNLIVANFRDQTLGTPYNIFDFSYVGFFTALIGVIFVGLFGWRLLPRRGKRKRRYENIYMFEIRINPQSQWIDKSVNNFLDANKKTLHMLGMIRRNRKYDFNKDTIIKSGDRFIVEATSAHLQELSSNKDFIISNQMGQQKKAQLSDDVLLEAVVPTKSKVQGKTLEIINFPSRYKFSVLGLSRRAQPSIRRLRKQQLLAGDMLLIHARDRAIIDKLPFIGIIPITELNIHIGSRLKAFLPLVIFAAAILAVALSWIPVDIGFAGAALMMILFKLISFETIAKQVDWSVVILLAAMIPIGHALTVTGGAELISHLLFTASLHLPLIMTIGLVLVITMFLSDFINNAATAVVMAPIAISLAQTIGISVDPFLMAVAVGASCAFLTPIGHQNNLIVMGPGNYKFFDYMRIGLPLEIIILCVATPLIYWFWYLK